MQAHYSPGRGHAGSAAQLPAEPHGLEEMQKQLEGAIEREQKQFDRLHFSHKKAQSDAAYARTMEKLLAQERVKNAELRGLHGQ